MNALPLTANQSHLLTLLPMVADQWLSYSLRGRAVICYHQRRRAPSSDAQARANARPVDALAAWHPKRDHQDARWLGNASTGC